MSDFFIRNTYLSIWLAALSAILAWILFTLGQDIRWGRLARDLSQERLAELIDIHPRTVQRWENDEMIPRAYHMKQLKELKILDELHVYSRERYLEQLKMLPPHLRNKKKHPLYLQIEQLNPDTFKGGLDG